MLTTSSGWAGEIIAPLRRLNYSVNISFSQASTSGINFFTIGTSTIGGNDIIKSGGQFVAFFDKYKYTDYSPYVMSIDLKKNIGQYPYGVFMAQCDIELDNSSLKFTPGHDATIGSGILPNRPIKVAMGFNNEYLNQFVGFAQQPDIDTINRVATFHGYDAFNFINGFLSQASGSYVGVYAQQIMAGMLGEMGFGANQYQLDQSLQQPIGYCSTYNQISGTVFQDLMEAEQGLAFADENGIINFWNRQHFTTTSGIVAFTLNYSSLSDLQYENTAIINDVEVKASPRAVVSNANVFDLSASDAITLPPQTGTLYIVNFSDPVVSVDTPIAHSGSSTSYYWANTLSDGTGVDMTGEITVVGAANFGQQYWLTFMNNSNQTLYLTKLSVWAAAAPVTQNIDQRYFDTNSILAYGRNPANNGQTIEISNDYIQDPSTANSLAYTLVQEYKTPNKRYLCPIAKNSNFAYQIGDYGILHIDDTCENKNVWITGKEEKIDRGLVYTQTIEVEERAIQHYFTIGTSAIGGTDSIAP